MTHTYNRFEAPLRKGAEALGVSLTDPQVAQLLDYLALLDKWNQAYNLTAVRDPAEMLERHLLDSLSIVPHVSCGPVLDVGSGGGLPGIPLAIVRPELQVMSIDSNGKKTRFQFQVKAQLGLHNFQVLQTRVEAFKPAGLYPCIVSRAFTEAADFVALTEHLLAEGGQWLAMKSARVEDELKQLPECYKVVALHELPLAGPERRTLAVITRT